MATPIPQNAAQTFTLFGEYISAWEDNTTGAIYFSTDYGTPVEITTAGPPSTRLSTVGPPSGAGIREVDDGTIQVVYFDDTGTEIVKTSYDRGISWQ